MDYVNIILLGGGKSTRFNYITNKINVQINGKYPLDILLDKISTFNFVKKIIVVGDVLSTMSLDITRVKPGTTRNLSIKNAVSAITDSTHKIIIHDIARPLVSVHLFETIVKASMKNDCCGLYIPLINSIIRMENQEMINSINRNKYVQSVTPQLFTYTHLTNIFSRMTDEDTLNSEMLDLNVKYNYIKPYLIKADYSTYKITNTEDYNILKLFDKMYDKTILITGITGCIGKNLLKHLALYNFRFIFITRSPQKVMELIHSHNIKKYTIINCDLSHPKNIHSIQDIECIDYIILLHGVIRIKDTNSMEIDEIQSIININYVHNILLINLLLQYCNQKSTIINISSSSIYHSRPLQQVYSSSKAAFHNYIEGLKYQYPHHSFYNIVPRRCDTESRHVQSSDNTTDPLDPNDVSQSIIDVLFGLSNKTMNGQQINLK